MVSLEVQPLRSSFGKVFMGAAGTDAAPSEDQFNRVSFLSHFDGANNGVNNAFDDGSTSNHTITANGNVTQGSFGPFARPDGEWAVAFDGSGDYLSVPDSADFDMGSGNFTAECWVFPTASPSQPIIMGQWSGSYSWAIQFSNNSSRYLRFLTNAGGIADNVSSTAVPLNQWSHVALVRNGTSFVAYLNGTSVVSSTVSGSLTNSTNALSIGGGVGGGQPYEGSISNVRIAKGTAVYTSNFTPSTAPLTAVTNTKLLTCQSNRFVDNSASGHAVTPSGNAAVSAFGPFLTSAVYDPAVNGASAYLDGDDKLTAATSSDFAVGSSDFTLSAWVYLTSGIDDNAMIAGYYQTASNQRSYAIYLQATTKNFAMVFSDNGTFQSGNVFASSIDADDNLNQWLHLTLKKSGTNATLYLNGTSIKTTSSAPSTLYTPSSGSFAVGSFNTSDYIQGYVSDVKLVNGTATTPLSGGPTSVAGVTTNTKLLLNMADGQAIDSAAQSNLTLFGTAKTSTAQKKFGTASLLLDGNSDYVAIPAINLTNSFTMEFFAYLSAWPNSSNFDMFYGEASAIYMCFTSAINGSGSDRSIQLAYDTSGYSGITQFNVNSAMNAGAWHHVAITKNSSNVHVCYIDGTSVTATNATKANTFSTTGTHFIGRGYSPSYHYFGGYIDDFRISQFVRYTSNFTAPTEPFADKGQ